MRKRQTLEPENKDVQRVLGRALELLSDRQRWTTRTLAVNSEGLHAKPEDDEAVAWCAVGAIQRAAYELCEADATAPDQFDLMHAAQQTLTPVARTIAKVYNPNRYGVHSIEITQINDHAYWGGWGTIVKALSAVCGEVADLPAETLQAMHLATERSERARKGWETRKRRLHERYQAILAARAQAARAKPQPHQPQPQPEPTMTFGGTIVASPTNADAKEIAV